MPAVLALVIVAFIAGKIVPEYVVIELRKERDEWKRLALELGAPLRRGTAVAERSATVAEQAANIAAELVQRRQRQRLAEGGERDERE